MRAVIIFLLWAGFSFDAYGQEQCQVSFAPTRNLGQIDKELIEGAKSRINMAAYRLTDIEIVSTLMAAISKGTVALRIVLDENVQCGHSANAFLDYTKVKPKGRPLMHLKAYSVDGAIYRSGSANFSPPGLRRQNNDLIVCTDPAIAKQFDREFEVLWNSYRSPQCK